MLFYPTNLSLTFPVSFAAHRHVACGQTELIRIDKQYRYH